MLAGNTRPAVTKGLARDQGMLPGSQAMPRLSIHFAMTVAQRADLDQLLAAQQNRRSPQYRKFLTPEEYAARFGLNSADIETVTRGLENRGLSNIQAARAGTAMTFSGTARNVEAAFHTHIHRYSSNGETYIANASDPQLPKALEGVVQAVGGLHGTQMQPPVKRDTPQYSQSSNSFEHWLAPDDWEMIYDVKPLYGAGLDGSGVSIAVSAQSNVRLSDIQAFRSAAGLPAKNPTVITPPGYPAPGPPSGNGDEFESDMDLEWSGAIARNADVIFITTSTTGADGVEDSLTYAIDSNVAPIISMSYGRCEADVSAAYIAYQADLFAQAAAQGITIVVSSGDRGAATCDTSTTSSATHGLAVDYPASSPYVTGVGGTEFSDSSPSYWNATNNGYGGSVLSYIPERAWNDGYLLATGGGASKLFRNQAGRPGWACRSTANAMCRTWRSLRRLSMRQFWSAKSVPVSTDLAIPPAL